MNRRLALSLLSSAIVVSAAGSAFAWETRVLTLGDQNRFVEDDANIWLYPQKVMNYGDRLYLDLARKSGDYVSSASGGGKGSASTNMGQKYEGELDEGLSAIQGLNGGFFLDISDSFHMAFWASQFTDTTMQNFLEVSEQAQTDAWMSGQGDLSGQPLRTYDDGANRKMDVFAGWRLSPTFDLGAHLWYGSGNFYSLNETQVGDGDTASDEVTWDHSNFGVGLGSSIKMFSETLLDLGVQYSHYSYTMDHNGQTKPSVDGGNTFTFDGRMNTRLSKDWYLVPAVQFNYTGISGLVETEQAGKKGLGNNTSSIDLTGINFDLGLGLQMKVVNKANLYTAVGIDYRYNQIDAFSDWSVEQTFTETLLELPYWRTGFEAPLFSWLDFRAGFIKRWGTYELLKELSDPGKDNGEGERDNRTYYDDKVYSISEKTKAALGGIIPDDFETFIGSSIHYNGWVFTTEIDPNLMFQGPFTGADGNKWFARMDIAYHF